MKPSCVCSRSTIGSHVRRCLRTFRPGSSHVDGKDHLKLTCAPIEVTKNFEPEVKEEREEEELSTEFHMANKTQEINQYISNISEDINKIPPVETELCLSIAPECCLIGYTALHVAALCNDVETARMLIEKGADMYRLVGLSHLNCLHTAVFYESLDIIRFLVTEVNMDKERTTGDSTGETALDIAEWIAEDEGETETMGQIIQLLQS